MVTWHRIVSPFFVGIVSGWIFLKNTKQKQTYLTLLLGFILFFFFSQNNPFGYYFLPYPAAAPLAFVRRIYHQFYIYFSFIGGIGLTLGIFHGVHGFKQVWRHLRKTHLATPLTDQQRKGIYVLLLSIPCFFLQGSETVVAYYTYMIQAREYPVLTHTDWQAFQWIERTIPDSKRFFVSRIDAGKWIHILLDNIILPHDRLSIKHKHQELETLTTFLIAGTINETTLSLLKDYEIEYIYIGQRRHPQFSFLPRQFNRSALENATNTFTLVYEVGKVQIYAVAI